MYVGSSYLALSRERLRVGRPAALATRATGRAGAMLVTQEKPESGRPITPSMLPHTATTIRYPPSLTLPPADGGG